MTHSISFIICLGGGTKKTSFKLVTIHSCCSNEQEQQKKIEYDYVSIPNDDTHKKE